MKSIRYLCLFLLFLAGYSLAAQQTGPTDYLGPEHGYLLIAGGGRLDTAVMNRFVSLAGGPSARFLIIPTAGEQDTVNEEQVAAFLKRYGAEQVRVVHTRDPRVADTEEFVKPIREANAVWFSGGRQWRLVDAYAGTHTETELRKLLDRGGVIGGSSAGATIQGSFLVRGDTRTNTIMMGDHQAGFNYLRQSAIDQHLLVRNRQFDLIEVLEAHPDLLGIGLDEGTAIVVHGNSFEVLGPSFVAVYDTGLWDSPDRSDNRPALPNGGKFFLLRNGDRYDLLHRTVTHWSGVNRGLTTDRDIK